VGGGVGIAVVPVGSCADVFKVTRSALAERVVARVAVGVGVRGPATTYPARYTVVVVHPCVVVVVVDRLEVSWEVPELAICISKAKLRIRQTQLLATLGYFELRVV
jgi:hypothetical protein